MKKALFFLFVLLFFTSNISLASIYITFPEKLTNYQKIAEQVKSDLKKNGVEEITILTSKEIKDKKIKENDLIVFLGNQQKNEHPNIKGAKIFSFTNNNINIEKNDNLSIININQPIKKLLKTAEKMVNKQYKKNILFIISAKNTRAIKELKAIKKPENIKIIIVNEGEIAAKLLEPELTNAAAIVAIHDSAIWSGNSARWILQQAYNFKVPIIGYSKAFLKAGAMASVYSSADQIIQETNKHILLWTKEQKLNNRVNYPEYTIEVNNNIAKALNFSNIEIVEIGQNNDF